MYDSTRTVKIFRIDGCTALSVAVLVTGIIYSYIFGHSTAEYIKIIKHAGISYRRKEEKLMRKHFFRRL